MKLPNIKLEFINLSIVHVNCKKQLFKNNSFFCTVFSLHRRMVIQSLKTNYLPVQCYYASTVFALVFNQELFNARYYGGGGGGGNQNFKIVLILTKKKIGSKNGYSLSRNIPCLVPFIPEMCWWGEGGGDALKIPLFNFHVDLSQCHLSSLSRPPGKIQKIFTLLIYSFYRLISPLWPLPLSAPPPHSSIFKFYSY